MAIFLCFFSISDRSVLSPFSHAGLSGGRAEFWSDASFRNIFLDFIFVEKGNADADGEQEEEEEDAESVTWAAQAQTRLERAADAEEPVGVVVGGGVGGVRMGV